MMKKTMFLALAAWVVGSAFVAPTPAARLQNGYAVQTATSRVEFVGTKGNGYHTGFFNLKGGQVMVNNGKISGGEFTIDLTSLKVTDEGGGEKLEGHLKNKDFFETSVNTEARYTVTGVKYINEDVCEISGNLSMKGITAPVTLQAMVRGLDDKRLFAQANFSIDRTVWGINYGVAKGGISKDVQVSIFLFANK
jgi:polyisoprenoid-binding protein YceI